MLVRLSSDYRLTKEHTVEDRLKYSILFNFKIKKPARWCYKSSEKKDSTQWSVVVDKTSKRHRISLYIKKVIWKVF